MSDIFGTADPLISSRQSFVIFHIFFFDSTLNFFNLNHRSNIFKSKSLKHFSFLNKLKKFTQPNKPHTNIGLTLTRYKEFEPQKKKQKSDVETTESIAKLLWPSSLCSLATAVGGNFYPNAPLTTTCLTHTNTNSLGHIYTLVYTVVLTHYLCKEKCQKWKEVGGESVAATVEPTTGRTVISVRFHTRNWGCFATHLSRLGASHHTNTYQITVHTNPLAATDTHIYTYVRKMRGLYDFVFIIL